MERTILITENYDDHWKLLLVGWLVLTLVVSLVAGFGFWGTPAGMTGLAFGYWGLASVVRSVSSRSIEESEIGALDGRRETVAVVGQVRPAGEPFSAPFSGTDCAACKVE